MQLIMYIGDRQVDSIPVSINELQTTGYVEMLKGRLEEKNEDILDLTTQEPRFFIDTLPSRMNHPDKLIVIH